MNEALKILGYKFIDEMFVDSEGVSYDSLTGMICGGLFGFCGCGDNDYEMKKFREVLLALQQRVCLDFEYQIYLYLLDNHEFTEHGFSVFGSWLTEKGEALLFLLNKWEDERVEDTILP